jgi:hypothetical protein
MPQDIFEVLPLEICVQCITEACSGDDYMTNLLTTTTVSRRWCQLLTQTPTLWTVINVKDVNEDSMEAIFTFLQLSASAHLSLEVWAPLARGWYSVAPLIADHRNRIRKIILHADDANFRDLISDSELQGSLQEIFETLHFPESIQCMDVIVDHPVAMGDSTWIPPNLLSTGNWLLPSHVLAPPSSSFPGLYRLSIQNAQSINFFLHILGLTELRYLHLYSNIEDDSLPTLYSPEAIGDDSESKLSPPGFLIPLGPPHLSTLRYHGRFHQTLYLFVYPLFRTLRTLDLQIRIVDLQSLIEDLETCHSLRCFGITLLLLQRDFQHSYHDQRLRISSWRLEQVEDLRCEMKMPEPFPVSRTLVENDIWESFRNIFPNIRKLVWNLPPNFSNDRKSEDEYLFKVKGLRSGIESLKASTVEVLKWILITDISTLSISGLLTFHWPDGYTFSRLNTLTISIDARAQIFLAIEPQDFKVLERLSITFLGPRGGLQFLDHPSLIELTISTKLPTFRQGINFCASLVCHPSRYPRLEQINLDTFPEWDILYVLLRRRNLFQGPTVSRIKSLGLASINPRIQHLFGSLLAGRDIVPPQFLRNMATSLSIEEAQSRLLNEQMFV